MPRDVEMDEEYCPNCGQYTGGEPVCPNCGAILGKVDDDMEGFHEDEEGDIDDDI